MAKFKVEVPEVWIQSYEVEADDEGQARDIVNDHRGFGTLEAKETAFDYSHTVEEDDIEKWEVSELG